MPSNHAESPSYQPAARLDDCPVGKLLEVECDGKKLLLARTDEGVFATQPLCSHARKPLRDGRLNGATLHCPHHAAKFDVRDGRVLGPPAFKPLRTFPARVQDDSIEVCVDSQRET